MYRGEKKYEKRKVCVLTRPRDFQHMAKHARKMIISNDRIMPDYQLMEILKLSPTSWKVWKPVLIQKYSLETYDYTNEKGESGIYRVEYIKKEKTWIVELLK